MYILMLLSFGPLTLRIVKSVTVGTAIYRCLSTTAIEMRTALKHRTGNPLHLVFLPADGDIDRKLVDLSFEREAVASEVEEF